MKIKKSSTKKVIKNVFFFPVKNVIFFPNLLVPLFITQSELVQKITFCKENDIKDIFLFPADIKDAKIGIYATISQIIKLPDGIFKVFVDTKSRGLMEKKKDDLASISLIEEDSVEGVQEFDSLIKSIISQIKLHTNYTESSNIDLLKIISKVTDPVMFANLLSFYAPLSSAKKYEILEIANLKQRLEFILDSMAKENAVLKFDKEIQGKIDSEMSKSQKNHFLREKIRILNEQLDEDKAEDKFAISGDLPLEVLNKIEEEKSKMKSSSSMSAEYQVSKNYIDFIISLPWNKEAKLNADIMHVEKYLDASHFGMEEVKKNILEIVATTIYTQEVRKNIICFIGPPGVGKTSIGKAIGEALDIPFQRISLGGVGDASEIKGHRRTYIGAMCGKILNAVKRSGVKNPIILLDEIDKMSSDARGDPAAALLEVLDPEQNNSFVDHYLDLPFDLSKIIFICTANNIKGIPRPLADRMEFFHIPSYLESEKIKIAQQYTVPRRMKENGLLDGEVIFTKDALSFLAAHYTRESGVREFSRRINSICRKIVREKLTLIQEIESKKKHLRDELLEESKELSLEDAEVSLSLEDARKVKKGKKKSDTDCVIDKNAVKIDLEKDFEEIKEEILHFEEEHDPFFEIGQDLENFNKSNLKKEIIKVFKVEKSHIVKYFGQKKYEHDVIEKESQIGLVNGLAYTEVGGDILHIEAVRIPFGKGEIKFTGTLGDVMKESVQAAYSFIKSRALDFKIEIEDLKNSDIHLHAPDGATPKDGPSAGIAIALVLYSIFTKTPISNFVAMTGEITLRGKVLPIGGLREKFTGAVKGGIKHAIIPFENKKDLEKIPKEILSKLKIYPVKNFDEVLDVVLKLK
jgi:ATP-dependent Lon protease